MSTHRRPIVQRRGLARMSLALALCAATVAVAPRALADGAPAAVTPTAPAISATLEQCVSSVNQAERTATFAGEMATIPGAARLEMHIEVFERLPGEVAFHAVSSPGLSVWRTAAPGVKTYRYLKEITNLSAPAVYRASVRFRWLTAKGKLLRAAELRTPRCVQPAGPGSGHKALEEPTPPA